MPLWSPLASDYMLSQTGSVELEALYNNGPYSHTQLKKKVSQASKLQDLLFQQSLEMSDFCDVTLLIDGKMMKAHWCVLVGCPYFKALYNFNKGMKIPCTDTVKMDFGDGGAMRAAIQYLYTGEVNITMDNVKDHLSVADYLQIGDLTTHCSQFLSSILLDINNCAELPVVVMGLQIMLMSSLYNLSTYDEAFKYVCGHLPELLSGDQLLDLTEVSILLLLTDPTLSYVRREDFFNFLVRWTKQDQTKRLNHFAGLFEALDLLSIPTPFLTGTIREHPFVKTSSSCQSLCMCALENKKRCAQRGSMMVDVVILGGGAIDTMSKFQYCNDHLSTNTLLAYFVGQNRWVKLPCLPYAIRRPLMTLTDDGKLLVVNSAQHTTCKRPGEILRYCPRENKWDPMEMILPPDEYHIDFHYFVACSGRVFFVASSKTDVVSRRCQPHRSHKVENAGLPPIRYHVQLFELDMKTGELRSKFVFYQRSIASEIRVTCSHSDKSPTLNGEVIYVMGTKCYGYKATVFNHSSTKVFCYDVRTNSGKELRRQCGFSFEPLALGVSEGFVNVRLGKVVQSLLQLRGWRIVRTDGYTVPLPPVLPSRCDFPYIVVHDELYVFGGKCSSTLDPTTSVIKYSFSRRAWTELESLPVNVLDAGITRGKLPLEALRCHAECPHCFYTPSIKRAVYNDSLFRNDEDSDEDMDQSHHYYDSDSGSDAWHYASPDFSDDEEDWGMHWL